jgi:DNA-binding transcriptional MerR regulator
MAPARVESPMAEFTIGALAQSAGVPTSTVRYYERRGILQPKARSESSYRLYGAEELDRLKFIRMAQSLGFTLDDAVVLLDLKHERPALPEQVDALISSRLAQVEGQLAHLREVKCLMETALGRRNPSCRCAKCDTMADFQQEIRRTSSKNA